MLHGYQMAALSLANTGKEQVFANLQICNFAIFILQNFFHNKEMTSPTMRAVAVGRQHS